MSKTEADERRHTISKLAIQMNDPLITPIAAIKRVTENVAYCEEWDSKHPLQSSKKTNSKNETDNWDKILENNKTFVDGIKARVEVETAKTISEYLNSQVKDERE